MTSLPLFDAPVLINAKPPKLRPYQERAIISLRARILLNEKRILAVGPTGCGKMTMIAAITRLSTIPMLFVCHRQELIDGCVLQLGSFGLTNLGVIQGADERYNPNASIQVASIQTLARRDKPYLDASGGRVLIFIDEAHRAGSDSYIEHIFRAYPNAIIIGWTATPSRLDGRPLGGELFQHLEVIATYEELLKHRDWLVAPDCYGVPIRADLSQVRIAGSDYDEGMLAQVMHTDILEGQIIEHWFRMANKHPVIDGTGTRVPEQFTEGEYRRTIVFCVNVMHSQAVAARFEKAGVRVAHLDGNTPKETRKNIWRDLASGHLQVVTNCNIGVEGVDVPEIKCIVHARPTQSLVLWRQSVGREERPWNNVIPLLLDHAGNFDRLGCPFEDRHWSLTSRPTRILGKLPMRMCKNCFAYVEPSKTVCPFCGTEFPRFADPKDMPAETAAELVLRQTEPGSLKRAYFSRQYLLAKTGGFKPGFPAAMYKQYYGEWPPDEWSDEVKLEFARNRLWQDALQRRQERNGKRAAREKEEREAAPKSRKKKETGKTDWQEDGPARWVVVGPDWTMEMRYRDGKWAWSVYDAVRQKAEIGEELQTDQAKKQAEVALAHLIAGRVAPASPEEVAMEKTIDAMSVDVAEDAKYEDEPLHGSLSTDDEDLFGGWVKRQGIDDDGR